MTDRDGEDQAFVDAISEWPDIDDGPPTLTDFLLARITEDEAVAREYQYYQENVYEAAGWWDCDCVLAECEAKRRIVEEYRVFVEPDPDDGIAQYADDTPEDRLWPEYGGGVFSGLRTVLRLLALPYADHPDYRPEWRP